MLKEIYENLLSLIALNLNSDLWWTVFPLIIATIIMLIYFEKYKGEKPGWNSYVANSLVLLFVSVNLFRYLYNLDGLGAINYVTHPIKFSVSFFILVLGIIILFLNFEHYLPEKIAMYISSPLTLNLIAYVVVLCVYSGIKAGISKFLALFILFILLIIILNLLKIPIQMIFLKIKKMKEHEKLEVVIDRKKAIHEAKQILLKEEELLDLRKEKIRKTKKKVEKKEKSELKGMLNEFEKQKKQAIKLKKIVRNPFKKNKKR